MRILLDESLPRRLSRELAGHSVRTVSEVGWSSVENGELLRRAAGQFDVFVTADQNLQFQQNLGASPLTVITLVARTNKLEELRPLVPCSSVWRRSRAGRLCVSAASHRLRLRRGVGEHRLANWPTSYY